MSYLFKLARRTSANACRCLLLGTAVACTDLNTAAGPDDLAVSLSSHLHTLTIGERLTLEATVIDATGATRAGEPLRWVSTDDRIATVDSAGTIEAVAAGETMVTVSAARSTDDGRKNNGWGKGGRRADTTIIVVEPLPVANVDVTPTTLTLAVDEYFVRLEATVLDADGRAVTDRPIAWTSSDTTVATVDEWGGVLGRQQGQATITATVDGVSGTAAVSVSPVAVAAVTIDPAAASVAPGASFQLSAAVQSVVGDLLQDRAVTWGSLHPTIAAVDGTGLVTGLAAGVALVTATSEGHADTATISVTAPSAASVTVSPATLSLGVDSSASLTATVRDANSAVMSGITVTWASANTAIATVSTAGTVTGIGAGTVQVAATANGITGSATVTVTDSSPPPPPPTGSILFASDWSTATGTTDQAFRDGVRWQGWGGNNINSAVTTASALGLAGWPVAHVYRVGTQASSPDAIQTHQIFADLGTPAAGDHRYYRLYLQVPYADSHGGGTTGNVEHGIESADAMYGGGDGMNLMRIPRADGTWFLVYRDIRTGQRWFADGLQLPKHETHRVEWHLAFGQTAYTVQIRVYNAAGTLIATEADFRSATWQGGLTLDQDSVPFNASDPAIREDYRWFRVGTNGPSSNFPMLNLGNEDLFLHGAVAVSSSGWVGPYNGTY